MREVRSTPQGAQEFSVSGREQNGKIGGEFAPITRHVPRRPAEDPNTGRCDSADRRTYKHTFRDGNIKKTGDPDKAFYAAHDVMKSVYVAIGVDPESMNKILNNVTPDSDDRGSFVKAATEAYGIRMVPQVLFEKRYKPEDLS